jgi:hypothetical protein
MGKEGAFREYATKKEKIGGQMQGYDDLGGDDDDDDEEE